MVKDFDGRIVVLGKVEVGAMFGEMALVDDQPRLVSAGAIGPVRAAVITRDMMARIMERIDPFSRGLIGTLSDHVRRMAADLRPELT
jgi:CRP-like cAMP-binding protein